MKYFKRFLLFLFLLLVLSQIPFAYRRYKLGRLNKTIQELNAQRVPPAADSTYKEYKGVVHVHSFLGGHSSGTLQDIIDGAKANGLQFVVMTEHPAKEFDTSAMTLKGTYAGILFVNGNEIRTREGDRLLVAPGDESTGRSEDYETRTIVARRGSENAMTIVAYPTEFNSWQTKGYDAVEIFNVYTNARAINPLVAVFDALWSSRSYPALLFANFYSRPTEAIAKWDEATKTGRVAGLGGNDAHANIGLSLTDASGKTVLGVKLDSYETSFRLVRVHVLIPQDRKLDQSTLLSAIKLGHCFTGFDFLSDGDGFNFTARSGSTRVIQGDEITLANEVRLGVSSPIPARIVLFKNGSEVQEAPEKSSHEFLVKERGTYRVELYLPQLGHPGGDQPWIISNPIYVK